MRRILTSIMTIGVVAAMMGVGTFAYFNDVESAGFTISAGAIDLEVDGENPWCESFDFELKPSWNWEKNFTLHMTADSNPAKVCFIIKDIVDGNGFETEPELWAEGAVYISPNGEMYRVENPTNNPFYSIKFEWFDDDNDGDGVKGGLSDVFQFNVNTDDAGYYDLIRMQAKAGNILGMVSIDIDCNAG